MDYINLLSQENVITFMLLFIRWSSILAFMPIFSSTTIPNKLKVSLAMWLTFVTFPITPLVNFKIDLTTIFLAILNEASFGFFTGIVLQIVWMILQFAGQLISFVMGLTMANIVDPSSGIQTPVISQFFTLVATTIFLVIDGHHYVIIWICNTLTNMPFGEFFDIHSIGKYMMFEMSKFFQLGFSIAFPILAISLLSDIIFGMIMKSMPQFNLLVVGFPIKIGISFVVIVSILTSMMFIFKNEIFTAIKYLFNLLQT
jgi:flagellar biosynthetic protein FliR